MEVTYPVSSGLVSHVVPNAAPHVVNGKSPAWGLVRAVKAVSSDRAQWGRNASPASNARNAIAGSATAGNLRKQFAGAAAARQQTNTQRQVDERAMRHRRTGTVSENSVRHVNSSPARNIKPGATAQAISPSTVRPTTVEPAFKTQRSRIPFPVRLMPNSAARVASALRQASTRANTPEVDSVATSLPEKLGDECPDLKHWRRDGKQFLRNRLKHDIAENFRVSLVPDIAMTRIAAEAAWLSRAIREFPPQPAIV